MERTRKGGKRVCEKNALQNFKNILNPLITSGKVDLLFPDKPNSPKQKYVKNNR